MPDKTTKNECRTIHQIKNKLLEEKAMITKAVKGNSIVILYIDDNNRKIDNFIFTTVSHLQTGISLISYKVMTQLLLKHDARLYEERIGGDTNTSTLRYPQ